nr:paired-like class homeodomain transcription factor Micro1/Pmar1 related [Prionocidaris baculosa]
MAESTSSFPPHLMASTKSRRRRPPTMFAKWQREQLEEEFSKNRYPDIDVRERLSSSLQLTEARIQVWFQNRRARHRCATRTAATMSSVSPSGVTTSKDASTTRMRRNGYQKRKSPYDVMAGTPTSTPPCKKTGNISPLMSIDFLARSSRDESTSTTSTSVFLPRDCPHVTSTSYSSSEFRHTYYPSTSHCTAFNKMVAAPGFYDNTTAIHPLVYSWRNQHHIGVATTNETRFH